MKPARISLQGRHPIRLPEAAGEADFATSLDAAPVVLAIVAGWLKAELWEGIQIGMP